MSALLSSTTIRPETLSAPTKPSHNSLQRETLPIEKMSLRAFTASSRTPSGFSRLRLLPGFDKHETFRRGTGRVVAPLLRRESASQIGALHFRILAELRAVVLKCDSSTLEHIGVAGHLQLPVRVLFEQHNLESVLPVYFSDF